MNYDDKIKFDYAQIGGVRLHYATAGAGEKLVILLHGFPEFWYSWRHQIVALSDEYTVVAPDMRGYNLSDKPPHVEDYAIDKLVDDVVGLINYFGHKQAAVIGHDWGAGVAWAVAQTHPEMLWKVGSLQVPPMPVWRKNLTFRQALASWYMAFFQLPILPEWVLSRNGFSMLVGGLKAASVDNKQAFTEKDVAEFKASWSRPDALTGAINYYRANVARMFFSNPNSQATEKIKVPTLFIYGEKDRYILPETVRNVGEFIDAPFEEFRIPDSGHWVQQEAADTVTQILRESLADK
jgi:epoxide hydrolase 4